MINPLSLIGSVGSAGSTAPALGSSATTTAGATGSGGSFASMLSDAASNTVGSLDRAQQVSIQALQGKADTRDVVDAVMNAQESLSAAIAIRDKIVSAYLDVTRMSI